MRQLYYLLVAEDLLTHSDLSYRKVKQLMVKARRHGRVPATVFSTNEEPDSYDYTLDAEDYIRKALEDYRIPRTCLQPNYLEVWVERDPMSTFMRSILDQYDIPVYVTGGFSSYSFTHFAAKRLKASVDRDGSPRILYFADFSVPSHNMFESQVTEMASLLDLTYDETLGILVKVCVTPEHIIRHDLPLLDKSVPKSKRDPFDAAYGDLLGLVGLPDDIHVEIESLNPAILTDIVYNSVFSLVDQSVMTKIATMEAANAEKLKEMVDIDE